MINEYYAKRFCKEDISKIENYDKAVADTTQTWHCHHRTEIWWNCSRQDLIDNECYYNRKACELVFLTPEEHRRLHSNNLSEETRRKLSESRKGLHLSEATRKKISESRKGKPSSKKGIPLSEETRKKMREAHKGLHKGKATSLFGKVFIEHFGITASDDIKLYLKEYFFYKKYNKFSWEI